jgi:Ribonuclease G/E
MVLVQSCFRLKAAETRANLKITNEPLYNLLIKSETGVLKAMVGISTIMANTGQRGGMNRIIRDLTDPISKQQAESAINTISFTKGKRGVDWLKGLMKEVQGNATMSAHPNLVTNYKTVMKRVIAGVRTNNEKAADILQEEYNKWEHANDKMTMLLDGAGS